MGAEHLEDFFGGFVGVAGVEGGVEGEDFCFGGDGLQGEGHVGGGHGSGADEDSVDRLEAEENFCVGKEAGEFDVATVLSEEGGDEGGEVGGAVDDHDAAAGAVGGGGSGLILKKGEDGGFVGGVGVEDGGDAGQLQQLGDDGGWVGEAEVAVTAAEAGCGADDEAEAEAVEAFEAGDFQNDLLEVAAGVEVEDCFELAALGAGDESAFGGDDVNGSADAGIEFDGHGSFYSWAMWEASGKWVLEVNFWCESVLQPTSISIASASSGSGAVVVAGIFPGAKRCRY